LGTLGSSQQACEGHSVVVWSSERLEAIHVDETVEKERESRQRSAPFSSCVAIDVNGEVERQKRAHRVA
jgi:hypothetical protein